MEQYFNWDFWRCGHVTRCIDGVEASANCDLSRIPRYDHLRSDIKNRLGDVCPRCYTRLLLERLQQLRMLIASCNNMEAIKSADLRLTAMRDFYARTGGQAFVNHEENFVNYSADFAAMIRHALKLESEICENAIAEFAAASRRLHSRAAQGFIKRIKEIRESALRWAEGGNVTVRGLLLEILEGTDLVITEIEQADAIEETLLEALDLKAGELSRILAERKRKIAWELEKLRRPTFELL
ncbi:hypothetical protein GGS24DRAFT_69875 [Hypoxylon argillaceum]|nr:hypothetical protein GGS24DRAFT_69875 [Hypoxylon argillaceum]